MNEHLKKVLRRQMHHPLHFCPTHQCWCRFSTEDWCLEEWSAWSCDYIRTRKEETVTFKRRER